MADRGPVRDVEQYGFLSKAARWSSDWRLNQVDARALSSHELTCWLLPMRLVCPIGEYLLIAG
jgi:hypothetical protein